MSTATQLTTKQKTDSAWKAMRDHKISSITVDFSGSGDSGAIDSIYPSSGDWGEEGSLIMIPVSVSDLVPPTTNLKDLIEELSQEILDRPEIPDWYNNEGGNGTIEWLANEDGTNTIETTVNVAIIEYDTSTFSYQPDDEKGFVEVDEPQIGEIDLAAQHQREQEALTGRE